MKLYELCGADRDLCYSPFVWRVIMCLHHKGLNFEREPLKFLELPNILTQEPKKVPVLVDEGRQISDSFEIVKYLEETYPDKPVFTGTDNPLSPENIEKLRTITLWVDRTVCGGLFPMLVKDIHDAQDTENQLYFRKSREERLGSTLEACHEKRGGQLEGFRASLEPLREHLKGHMFLDGAAPGWYDYCVFGTFQWARVISNFEVLSEKDDLYLWRERMLDLYDGVARKAKCAYS